MWLVIDLLLTRCASLRCCFFAWLDVMGCSYQVPLVREIMAGNKRGKRLLSLDD